MEREAILAELIELAEAAGIAVRRLPSVEGAAPARSGACRLRGATWVWVAPGDPVEDRIEAVAVALRSGAAGLLEQRYLPPAVRERLESPEPPARNAPERWDPGVPEGR